MDKKDDGILQRIVNLVKGGYNTQRNMPPSAIQYLNSPEYKEMEARILSNDPEQFRGSDAVAYGYLDPRYPINGEESFRGLEHMVYDYSDPRLTGVIKTTETPEFILRLMEEEERRKRGQ